MNLFSLLLTDLYGSLVNLPHYLVVSFKAEVEKLLNWQKISFQPGFSLENYLI